MDSPDGISNLRVSDLTAAIGHLEAGSWRLAELQCRTILVTRPNDVDVLLVLGLAIAASGEAARAAPILGRVRRERPDHADPCRDLARLRPRVPRAIVVRQYRAGLKLTPSDTRLRQDFAAYLLETGAPDAALVQLRDMPETPSMLNLRGMALAETGKFRDACRSFDAAVRQTPENPDLWANLGMMLRIEGRFDEALFAYDRAIWRDEHDPRLKINRAIALLHAGRWEEAWPLYEYRFQRPGFAPVSAAPALETLVPGARLDGMKLLVWHEEGFGDTIQFARYLPALRDLGADVTALVPAPLARLFQGFAGIEVAVSGQAEPPPHDRQCPFFSLPRVFGTSTASAPGAPYLAADPALAGAWSARLPGVARALAVGLVWSGQARPWLHGFSAIDGRRSVDLAAFAPLAGVRGVRFVSLQAGTAAAQGQEPPLDMDLLDPMEAVRDFADTAAIIANLDVVVSVDTSVAHLAGAMGKRVLLLDRYDNCWRWLHDRTDTPWYPSMTIFRQPRAGDWAPVLHRVASALAAMVAEKEVASLGQPLANAA